MICADEPWLSIIDALQSASVGMQRWEPALHALAEATGSRSAQLTGVESNASVLFNIVTNIDPLAHESFPQTAHIDPRIRMATEVPVLQVIADADFITLERASGDPIYLESLRRLDIPFACLTLLERREESLIVLAVHRSQAQGHITPEQRRTFQALAPHVRSAVRTHMALESRGAAVLTGAMETLSIPVYICNRDGRVIMLTAAAEALLSSDGRLQLKGGRLKACEPDDSDGLSDAIERALLGQLPPAIPTVRTVIVRGRDRAAPPLVLEVFPVPSQFNQLQFEPRVLVVARRARDANARRAVLLQSMYDLTSAETEIAQLLAEGQGAELISANRCVSVGTVRAQIKAIMSKLGVGRQIELVVRLGQL